MEYDKNLKENNPTYESVIDKEVQFPAESVIPTENVNAFETGVSPEEFSTSITMDEEEKLNKELEEKLQEANDSSGDGGTSASGGSAASAGGTAAVGAVAGAAAVVVAVAMAVSSVSGAYIKEISFTGTSLQYNVAVEMDYTVEEDQDVYDVVFDNFDTGVSLAVYNNNFEEIVPLIMGSDSCVGEIGLIEPISETEYTITFYFTGEVVGLSPNTRYKVELVSDKAGGGVTTYESRTVKTVDYETSLSGLEYECRCSIDGTFLFKLNYVDENGYYSDFTYLLSPSENNTLGTDVYGEITQPNDRQIIYNADSMAGIYYDLTVTFTSTAETDLDKIGTTENLNGTIIQYVQGEQGETIISITIQVEI